MRIIATRDFELFGTAYRAGQEIDLTEEAAGRLLRAGDARIEAAELLRHLKGKRLYTPAGMAAEMRFRRG